jgi:DNA-binding transcriptional ArsR family regulator
MAAAAKKRNESTLAQAVAHPIRSRTLVILAEREASPSEIARQLNLPVTLVGYHVTALVKANLIEETRNRPVRGAVEHFYRALELPVVSDDQEEEMAPAERRVYAESVWSVIIANAVHSIDVGTYLQRTDHHLTRHVMNLDEEGWNESTAAYMELYERMYEIKAAAAKRMAETDEKPMRVISFQTLFEVPRTAK